MPSTRYSKIRGVTHNEPHTGINRQAIIRQFVESGTELRAELEPENEYSPNAVAIWLDTDTTSFHLGYMGEELAAIVAEVLRQGGDVQLVVSNVTGGTGGKPTQGVNFTATFEEPEPRRRSKATAKRKIPLGVFIALGVGFVVCVLCVIITELFGSPDGALLIGGL